MDPNKTLQDVDYALRAGATFGAWRQAMILREWLDRHGFEPTNVDTYPRAWEYVQSLNTKEEE